MFQFNVTKHVIYCLALLKGIYIMLKLKRKLQFRGHVYFEAVRPAFVQAALTWLKANNTIYKNIVIDCTNISNEHTIIHHEDSSLLSDNDTDQESTTSQNIEELPTTNYNVDNADPIDHDNVDNETIDEDQDDPLNEHIDHPLMKHVYKQLSQITQLF